MITREEAIKRLDEVAKAIDELKAALEAGWAAAPYEDATKAFLEKCGGWEDIRNTEEIVAEIYAARTHSRRGNSIFEQE